MARDILHGFDGKPLAREQTRYWRRWKPSSGHPRRWRVTTHVKGHHWTLFEHEDSRGRLILYKSFASAQRKADELNRNKVLPRRLRT